MNFGAEIVGPELLEILDRHSIQQPQRKLRTLAGETLRSAVRNAIIEPLDFPPLSAAIYEGDCVVIVLQAAPQHAMEIIETVVGTINHDRAEPISITVLTDAFTAQRVDVGGLDNVSLVVHDRDDENQLACLAVGANDQPLYINRLLFDADIVIPIGCLTPQDNVKTNDCIYPWFSSRQNQEGFLNQSDQDKADDVQHVNDQLGTFFAIQLIVGPADSVHSVVAGDRLSVLRSAKQRLARAWAIEVETAADLVVATIESRAVEQNWDDFARALINADRCSTLAAPIVICSQLNQAPPREARSAWNEPPPESKRDATSAHFQIRQIISEHPVFLLSHLGQSDVEDLGLGYLAEADQLRRMAQRASRGVLLRDAHKCHVVLDEDENKA